MFDMATEEKLFYDYITPGAMFEFKALSKMWDKAKRSDKLVLGGRAALQKIVFEGSQAVRAASDDAYPTAQETAPVEATVFLKRAAMFQMQWSGFALESALSKGAAMDPEEFEKQGIMPAIADLLSRQIMGDGSGTLAQASTGATSATLVLDHPYFAQATKFMRKNKIIDLVLQSGPTKEVDSIKVNSVDSDTQVTLASSQTWTDNAWVYDEDVYIAAGAEAAGMGEMMGLLGICSDADPPWPNATAGLQKFLVASYPLWKAKVDTGSGTVRALTEDLLISVLDDDYVDISVMLITKKLRRVWISYLRNFKEFNDKVMWGGWVGVPFYYDGKEIPMVPDNFVPDGHILGVSENDLTLHVTNKKAEITWEQGSRSGGILQKVAGYNRYVAEGHIFANLGISSRHKFFKIDDLEEPTG